MSESFATDEELRKGPSSHLIYVHLTLAFVQLI